MGERLLKTAVLSATLGIALIAFCGMSLASDDFAGGCKRKEQAIETKMEYARKHGLTTKELFILDIIYFAQDGCTQAGICERLSATKQTVSAAIKKFWKLGYLSFEESKTDRRIRLIRFTAAGKEYVERIIPPAAQAENDAMAELSGEQQAELIRLTDLFSEQMRLKFQSINKNTL